MKRILLAVAACAAAVIAIPSHAGAGGWSVVSLDGVPELKAGATVDVGFTLLGHGVTPYASEHLIVAMVAEDGTRHEFAAEPGGRPGHAVSGWLRIGGTELRFDAQLSTG